MKRIGHRAQLNVGEKLGSLAVSVSNPKIDGRPDLRPSVRENVPLLGELRNDSDFTQSPRTPLILPTMPKRGAASMPGP